MAVKILFFSNTNIVRKLCERQVGKCDLTFMYSTAQKTHYDALDVPPNATHNEIKSAFYKLSLQYHPDKDSSAGAKERFQEISMAYEVLSNHTSRTQYDRRMRIVQTPAAATTKRQFRKNEYRFVAKPPIGGKMYNFEEWTQLHYSHAFEKQHSFTEKFNNSRRDKHMGRAVPRPEVPLKVYFLYVIGIWLYLMALNYITMKNDDAIALRVRVKKPQESPPENVHS